MKRIILLQVIALSSSLFLYAVVADDPENPPSCSICQQLVGCDCEDLPDPCDGFSGMSADDICAALCGNGPNIQCLNACFKKNNPGNNASIPTSAAGIVICINGQPTKCALDCDNKFKQCIEAHEQAEIDAGAVNCGNGIGFGTGGDNCVGWGAQLDCLCDPEQTPPGTSGLAAEKARVAKIKALMCALEM